VKIFLAHELRGARELSDAKRTAEAGRLRNWALGDNDLPLRFRNGGPAPLSTRIAR
jgi:hypothetical protein